jgi:hypothetical protein
MTYRRPDGFGAECQHGHLARQCERCDMLEEIADLKAALEVATEALEELVVHDDPATIGVQAFMVSKFALTRIAALLDGRAPDSERRGVVNIPGCSDEQRREPVHAIAESEDEPPGAPFIPPAAATEPAGEPCRECRGWKTSRRRTGPRLCQHCHGTGKEPA